MAHFWEFIKYAVAAKAQPKFKLSRDILKGICAPLLASSLVVYYFCFEQPHVEFDNSDLIKCLIFVNVVKIFSILTLYMHTSSAVAQIPTRDGPNNGFSGYDQLATYKHIALYMGVVLTVLAVHTVLLALPFITSEPPKNIMEKVMQFSCHWITTHVIACFAFLYMPFFLIGNIRFRNSNKDSVGVERFTNAFILGTNIPFIAAFVVVTLISLVVTYALPSWNHYFYVRHETAEFFFAGAIAFLVYSSTVASVCIDHYARPFLAANGEA